MIRPFLTTILLLFTILLPAQCGLNDINSGYLPLKSKLDSRRSAPTECEGSGWTLYRDAKCFKLIPQFVTKKKAVELCEQVEVQSNDPEQVPSTLASIKSLDEQQFLADYVFKTSNVKVNVWLGAKRSPTNGSQFLWDDDGTPLSFSNWINPTGPNNQSDRNCLEFRSNLTGSAAANLTTENGKWEDVTCELGNYALCQKLPRWSLAKLQKTLLDSRRHGHSVESQLVETQSKLASMQTQLFALQNNPGFSVPLGFIYTQIGDQPEPSTMWPTVTWTDVTSAYAGLFFRAQGGDSAAFGQIQPENSPRLSKIEIIFGNQWHQFINNAKYDAGQPVQLQPGQWSGKLFTGPSVPRSGSIPTKLIKDGFNFFTSGGEVRPRNMAVKIWKRTA